MKYDQNLYQDIWVRGLRIKGQRECESRYQSIKNYFEQYKSEKLNILDFGANNGYFSFRLAEDFPNFHITMVDYSPLLKTLTELNCFENIKLISEYMDEDTLISFIKENNFHKILMLSVLHHFNNPCKLIDFLTQKDEQTIFEIGYKDEQPVYRPEKVLPIYEHLNKKNPVQINSWTQHDRPIYYTNQQENIISGKIHPGAKMASTQTFPVIGNALAEQYGHKFYPGTLNVKLDKEFCFKNHDLFSGVFKIYPVKINGAQAYILLTEDKGTLTQEIEIIASYKIREKFHYKDGSKINIAINKHYRC